MRRIVPVLLTLLAAAPAAAIDQWIVVEPPSPAPGETVTLDLRLGERWEGTERYHDPTTTTLFQHIWKSGRENLDGTPGEPPLARFTTAERPGVELVVHSAHAPKTVHHQRHSKAVIVVGDAPEGGELHLSEIGQRLEIVPQTDPVAIARRGGPCQVQILWEREPVDGVGVYAMPESDPKGGFTSGTTDEIGLVTLDLDRPGRWMIGVAYKTPCEDCGETEVERTWASLTLVAGGE